MADISEQTIDLISDELTSNVAGFLINRLRDWESAYRYMTEDMQRAAIEDANRAAENLVREVVSMIAADGREVIPVRVKKVENDGSDIKVTLVGSKMDENRHALFDAAGSNAHLTVADPEQYIGGESPQPDPDQPTLDDASAA